MEAWDIWSIKLGKCNAHSSAGQSVLKTHNNIHLFINIHYMYYDVIIF